MKKTITIMMLLIAFASFGQKRHYPYQGGHYKSGRGSSHKGGHYVNQRTNNHYTHHIK